MVQQIVIIILLVFASITILPMLIWLYRWNKSFIHTVHIAKQTGKDTSDVLWVQDKYKVVDRDGVHTIIFKQHKGRAPSFNGALWTKFFKKKDAAIGVTGDFWSDASEKKSLSFSEDLWTKHNMRNNIVRGLFLYQTTEGEFHPITVESLPSGFKFRVLTQDNRAFLVQGLKETATLTLSAKKQLIALGMIIGGLVLLGFAFFFFMVYLTEAGKNVCATAGTTLLQTTGNVVSGVGG